MPDSRDPRYRGRRRTSAQRRPGHLRTNYTEDDIEAFNKDLEHLRSVWPQSVRDGDRKAIRTKIIKTTAIVCGIIMLPVTAFLVWIVVDEALPWWAIPVGQTLIILYFIVWVLRANGGENTDIIIYREADRRGVKYVKGDTPLYHIMNRLNADYNSHLWNRTFRW